VEIRRALILPYALGSLAWPVGLIGFGGWDDLAGATIIGVGSIVILLTMAAELLLRVRDRRRGED
jgi:hypothetical protein